MPVRKKCSDGKTNAHKLRFIDSVRFMSASLSELVDNMSGKTLNSIVCTECMEKKN